MANELIKGDTFVDGQEVTGARLNNLVDLARALKGLILEQPPKSLPIAADEVLIYDSQALPPNLARAAVSSLPAITSVGLDMPSAEFNVTGSPVTHVNPGPLTARWKPQPGNKFFAGNGTGTGTTPSFRLIAAEDIALAPVEIPAGNNIDWSLGNVFHLLLTTADPGTFLSFSNPQEGQTIKVILVQDGAGNRLAHFPAHIWWKGGAYPTQNKVANAADIWEFTAYGGAVLGQLDANYRVID